MLDRTDKTHFEEFLDDQTKPSKPTPKDVEWATKRFSSRAEPPKT